MTFVAAAGILRFMPRPIRATISAAALAHNLAIARAHAGAAKIWAVVKANAYGHGILRAAQALREADGLAMLDYVEALKLRGSGITKPILMLEGFFKPEDIVTLLKYKLTPVIHSMAQIEILEKVSFEGSLDVYLKVNSGMNRLGFTESNLRLAWNALEAHKGIGTVTLMTHFADAEGEDGIQGQLQWFGLLTRSFHAPRSYANSAALLRFPEEARADWVRPGIMLYGCSPLPFKSAEEIGLKPAMTLASEIIGVQHLEKGERVGYGFSYQAAREMTIGVIACGYADGYPRNVGQDGRPGATVILRGRRVSIVGRVTMDMIMVDVTGIECALGETVTLIGRDGDDVVTVAQVGQSAGITPYEVLVGMNSRSPRSQHEG